MYKDPNATGSRYVLDPIIAKLSIILTRLDVVFCWSASVAARQPMGKERTSLTSIAPAVPTHSARLGPGAGFILASVKPRCMYRIILVHTRVRITTVIAE